ncbi:hypothetical protein HD597_000496 [Nonomuraea thailandensis]|uniref:Transposase n=1 Tax=Nonomuraea thailandensis TaxID=1188745 RepID=A0A9X2GDS2_9ACTN|nr:hypothetical protein [Nonomuraea thailandensis]
MLSYPAAISLSNHTLIRLAELIRIQRAERRSRWRSKASHLCKAIAVLQNYEGARG